MNAPREAYFDPQLSTPNAEIDELLVDLETLSVRGVSTDRFYTDLLDGVVRSLNATAASFWRREGEGLRCEAQYGGGEGLPRPAARRLMAVLATGKPARVAAGDQLADHAVLACPVSAAKTPIGVLVATLPSTRGGDAALLDVLAALGEIADQYELRHRLAVLEQDSHTAARVRAMSLDLQDATKTQTAARIVAEEGRRLVSCDRLTVALRHGKSWRVAAVSGVENPSPRSDAVRSVEKLVAVAMRSGDAVSVRDGNAGDHPPQLADALQRHVDEGFARELIVVPCHPLVRDDEADASRPQASLPEAALIVEQFDGCLSSDCEATTRLVAEQAAASIGRIRGAGWLGGLRRKIGFASAVRHVIVATLAIGLLSTAAATLVLVPAELRVAAEGRLVPSERARVFAPMDATVGRVLVDHGEAVAAGQVLLELRSETLELDLEQAREALATTQQEITALGTAKLRAGLPGFQQETDISAITSRIESLTEQTAHQRRRIELLIEQQQRLTITSPMAGRIVSWRPNDYLGQRPVRRGQRLLEVAAVDGQGRADGWTIELDFPDHRAGRVLAAAGRDAAPLQVDYVMKSDPSRSRCGHVTMTASTTQANAAGEPTVRVEVDPGLTADESRDASLRSGATVLAKLHCGEHCLGYVWFHEAWDAIQRFWF